MSEAYTLTANEFEGLLLRTWLQGADNSTWPRDMRNAWIRERMEAFATPTPSPEQAAEAEQWQRSAAFMTALRIAQERVEPPRGMFAFEAISRIQLFLCGHGDATPGAFEAWMGGETEAAQP